MKTGCNYYFTLAGISLCSLPLISQKSTIKKPNIIVIMSDDIGYSDLGCFGSEIKTPNIDRLANNGVRFTQFYNTARCSPSRAALLTGLYPHQAGMGHLSSENYKEPGYVDDLSKNAVTIAEVLKNVGYSTYMTGKWHLAKDMKADGDNSNWPLQRGFDRYFGTLNGSGSFYDPGTLISNNTFVPPGRNFYYTDAISDTAVKFIKQHPQGKPFFFYVAYTAAHWPLHAPENEVAKYKGAYDIGWDSLRARRFRKLKQLGIISSNCVLTERSVTIPSWEKEPMKEWQARRMEVYAAMIDVMDQGIGKIITALEQKGELENTVIFYMQDNGGCAEPQGSDKLSVPLTDEQKILRPFSYDAISTEKRPVYTRDGRYVRSGKGVMAGPADTWMAYSEEWANVSNTPYREYKQWVHEGGIASPMIVHWPARIKSKGQLNRELSHLIDIMPTCLEIAGVKYPSELAGNKITPVEGVSLMPALNGKKISREFMFWEHSANRAIRMGDWKLVAKVKSQKKFIPADENAWELYNLEIDPSETNNLVLKYPDKVKEMSEKWEKEAVRTKTKPWPWDQAQQSNNIRLNDGWQFLKSELGGVWEAVRPVKAGDPESVPIWENVNLPHCFNATDAVDPDVNYYQGPGWYRTNLKINNPFPNGRILLHFEGAGQKTQVYVYTKLVGTHTGGYDEFSFDITDAVNEFTQNKPLNIRFNGTVPISIRCDNSRDLEMIPSDLSDFNLYGGMYRYLNLKYVPSFSIEKVRVTATPEGDGKSGKITVSSGVLNKSDISSGSADIKILDPEGNVVVSSLKSIETSSGEQEILSVTIKKPILWSPSHPYLYTCRITLTSSAGEQVISEKFGFRSFEFVKNGPFKLNGQRLLLQGTHRHEDHAGVAQAMTEDMIRKEMVMMKEMGVNFIRLGHYQQSRIVLNLCDSLGILVWEEIPWCRGGLGGEKYKEQARRMLTNMIEQHRNHPSVIIWGLGNENDWPGDFPEFEQEKIRAFMTELNNLAHKLDPSRKTAIRRCAFCKDIVDVYSPSIWAGWYSGRYSQYKSVSEKEMKSVDHFLHVEWGGDSHAGRHSEDPDRILSRVSTTDGVAEKAGDASLYGGSTRVSKDGDWSETYICNLIDWHLKEQETMPWLTGTAYWPFKDFSTPIRPENPVPYVNQKGVVERDLTKKESYFVFQSYWATKPMAHIYGHSWPVRWGDEDEMKMVKVYSNCPEAELFLNEVSCGVKKRNSQDFPAAGLRWNVKFKKGENRVRVVAIKGKERVTDEITFVYQTEKWEKPEQLVLEMIDIKSDTITLQAKLLDSKGVLCLDSRNYIEFLLAGDGKLFDNLGTSTGSGKVQAYNGRAIIRMRTNKGKNIAAVKSEGLETVFLEIKQ